MLQERTRSLEQQFPNVQLPWTMLERAPATKPTAQPGAVPHPAAQGKALCPVLAGGGFAESFLHSAWEKHTCMGAFVFWEEAGCRLK